MANMKATTYDGVKRLTDNSRRGTVTLGNNTTATAIVGADPRVVISLHGHEIIALHPDGAVTVTTAGWDTVTTRDRLSTFCPRIGAPCGPHRRRGVLHFYSAEGSEPWDGEPLTVDSDGHIIATRSLGL